MTNNELCELLGLSGCAITFVALVLMFFGVGAAVWGAVSGVLLGYISLKNFD